MDTCTPVSSISEDFVSCVKNAYFCCELTNLGTKQCSTCISAQESVKVVPVEGLNNFQGCSNGENLKVEKLGIAFSDVHIEESLDQWPCHKPSLELEMCNLKDDTACQKDEKQNIPEQDALDGNIRKGFSKSATFPCSGKMQPSSIPLDAGEIIPSASLQAQCSLKSDHFVYARSNSLPAIPKLVSALKGGREKEGASMKTKQRVKWAPDVYDPPATSMSHTVKNNHYQRPKAKRKDQHKHKHKNKSSRGSTREKKQQANHSNLSGNANPQHSRLQVAESSAVIDVSAQSSFRVLSYMASNQESKCGSSVNVGSLAKLHFSIGEAT